MQEVIIPTRILFSKKGRAKYISHLDTMRTFTRALRRSGLPLWYTQGFNPHLYLTFPLPLALGVESLGEPLDIRLTREMEFSQVKEMVARCFPPGFEVIGVDAPRMAATEIAWAEYDIRLAFPQEERESMLFALQNLFAKDVIEVMKHGKKGPKLVDIRPHSTLLESGRWEGGICFSLRLAAGSTLNISPSLVLEAFEEETRTADRVEILRTRILDGEWQEFA